MRVTRGTDGCAREKRTSDTDAVIRARVTHIHSDTRICIETTHASSDFKRVLLATLTPARARIFITNHPRAAAATTLKALHTACIKFVKHHRVTQSQQRIAAVVKLVSLPPYTRAVLIHKFTEAGN